MTSDCYNQLKRKNDFLLEEILELTPTYHKARAHLSTVNIQLGILINKRLDIQRKLAKLEGRHIKISNKTPSNVLNTNNFNRNDIAKLKSKLLTMTGIKEKNNGETNTKNNQCEL